MCSIEFDFRTFYVFESLRWADPRRARVIFTTETVLTRGKVVLQA